MGSLELMSLAPGVSTQKTGPPTRSHQIRRRALSCRSTVDVEGKARMRQPRLARKEWTNGLIGGGASERRRETLVLLLKKDEPALVPIRD